jgi:hypothetical protein
MRKMLPLLVVAGALVTPLAVGLGACSSTPEEKAGAGAVGGAAGAIAGHVQEDSGKPQA